MATAPGQTRQLHPLVTLDYRVRMVSMVVVALIPLFHFRGRPPLPMLAGMIFMGLLWPQIAYVVAKNARDTRAAEFRNILFDSFLVGAWAAAMSFSLFPSAVMVAALNSANLSVGGLRQAARGLAAIVLGMVVVGLPLGFRVQPESDLRDRALLHRRHPHGHHDLRLLRPPPDEAGAPGEERSLRPERSDRAAEPGDRTGAADCARSQGGGGGRQPVEERVPGEHEPRAPDAAERDHRVQRDARGGRGGLRPDEELRVGPRRRSGPSGQAPARV